MGARLNNAPMVEFALQRSPPGPGRCLTSLFGMEGVDANGLPYAADRPFQEARKETGRT
jgi:hypothetical protein